jgi:hypothetical protein
VDAIRGPIGRSYSKKCNAWLRGRREVPLCLPSYIRHRLRICCTWSCGRGSTIRDDVQRARHCCCFEVVARHCVNCCGHCRRAVQTARVGRLVRDVREPRVGGGKISRGCGVLEVSGSQLDSSVRASPKAINWRLLTRNTARR